MAAPLRLYCLPPAGAGAMAYRGWGDRMPGGVDVRPILLPGRENRLAEDPIADLTALVGEIAAHLDTATPGGYAILGHSFGALAAFETVRLLRRTGAPAPELLVVLGAPAPQLPIVANGDADELAFLRRMGGTAEQVLAHPRMMRLILPALRADVAICRDYRYAEEPALDTPIVAMAATGDQLVPVEAVAHWHAQTTTAFRFEVLTGDHFFPGRSDRFFEVLSESCTSVLKR